ncbi:MAG TPA: HTTM domain-containing protein [Kofleriaceae bacterium]
MKRIADWWFSPAPAERLAALRILIGGYALIYIVARLPELAAVARYGRGNFHPVGIVRVLAVPLPPGAVLAIAIATCVLLAAFVAGFAYRITAPLAALALLWTLTYRNAWGQIFHTENLLVLHVIALALVPAAANAWAVDKPRDASAGYGWPIKLLAALTAATYVLAGIAKLRIAGIDWVDGELLRNQIAVDNLRKALLGDRVAPLAHLFLDHPSPLVGFSVLTLVLELGAPLALFGRRLGYVWAFVAWAFHLGVVLMMNIWFPYPLAGIAFLPLLPAERIVQTVIGAARGIVRRTGR